LSAAAPEPVANAPGTLDTVVDQDEDRPGDLGAGGTSTTRGASGWNDWVRRNFSAQRLFRTAPSNRRPGGPVTSEDASLSPAERSAAKKAAVNNLDARETRFGVIALIVEMALTAIIVAPYLTHRLKPSKTDFKTLAVVHEFLLEGVVVAVFLLLGLLLKRRALLGFASLAAAIWLVNVRALFLVGLAFLGFGIWLLVRGYKSQQGGARRPAGGASSKPRATKSARSQAEALGKRSPPKPNKRYTPPKPVRRPAPKKRDPARAEPTK
jgi:hypothetical protein